MTRKTIAAVVACLSCAFLQAEAAQEEAKSVRVYPTPKRLEITGGESRVQPGDAKYRRTIGLGEEGYRIVVGKDAITVEASTETGDFYARQTLRQLASGGAVPCCTVEDSPDVPLRGAVEGFYGRPWGTEGRLDLMDFMGEYKMNCFIYGPKDDPYHQSKWKEKYPRERIADFRRLLDAAQKNHVKFYWAVHLGDAFKDPSPAAREAEYAALWRKLDAMYDAGFRCFAVFFDDFGGADAELHAEISNSIKHDFLDRKGDCAPLIMCPNNYVGDDQDPYSQALGEKTDKDILIMWTGMGICSDITADATAKRAKALRRTPFVWWNWPVNDFLRCKLHMGRTYGVDPYPYSGFVSNPMENLEASKVALFGIADMLWNQRDFDSVRSWHDGMRLLYPFAAKAMLQFCEHNTDTHKDPEFTAGWYREESERFMEAWKSEGKAALVRECEANAAAAEELSKVLPEKAPKLWREIRYWVAFFGAQAREGIAAAKGNANAYVKAKDEGKEIQRQQKAYFQTLAPEWDRCRCVGCVTATRHFQKIIDDCAKAAFRSRMEVYERYFPTVGTSIGTLPAIAKTGQHFENDDALLVLDGVLEQQSAKPGDWFGMKMAKNVTFKYVWLNFETADAVANGRVEVSKDGGATWQTAALEVDGKLLFGHVDANAGFNAVRWLNTSDRTVDFKIVRFNVDIVK